jgi:hypothetical protein
MMYLLLKIVAKIYHFTANCDPEVETQHTLLGEVQFYLPTLCIVSNMDYPIINGKKEGFEI